MTYASTAITAAKLITEKELTPPIAWSIAVRDEFPNSISNQLKGCPKNTFLGLCEIGCIKGIPAGNYTKSESNKVYGLIALLILTLNKNKLFTPIELWQEVLLQNKTDLEKQHNSQMNVIIALWNEGLIKT